MCIAETNLRGEWWVNGHRRVKKKEISLFVSEAETLDHVTVRKAARADVFVAICSDDVCLVAGREEEGSQERCVSQYECPSRRIFVRGEGVKFCSRCRCLRRFWGERVTFRVGQIRKGLRRVTCRGARKNVTKFVRDDNRLARAHK